MNRTSRLRYSSGFTLIEILIVLAITGVVMAGIYQVYISHQRTYVTQLQVVEMQQNLRAASFYLAKDLRMAGFDPTDAFNFGIITAQSNLIRFTKDTNENGILDSNEDITYGLYDAYGDGDSDLGRRVGGGGYQPVAENIDVLNFVYFDADGNTPVANVNDIRSVQITIIARSERDLKFTDTTAYYNDQGDLLLSAQNDHHRRRLSTYRVQCRNMGL